MAAEHGPSALRRRHAGVRGRRGAGRTACDVPRCIRAPASGCFARAADQAGEPPAAPGARHSLGARSLHLHRWRRHVDESSPPKGSLTAVGRSGARCRGRSNGRIVLAACATGSIDPRTAPELDAREPRPPRITPAASSPTEQSGSGVRHTTASIAPSTAGARSTPLPVRPSGDDFQLVWIDPRRSDRLLAGVDQGAVVSVARGNMEQRYNQPTGQFYHVITDTRRFRITCTPRSRTADRWPSPNRSDFGEIGYRDGLAGRVRVRLSGAGPLDPDIVFAGCWYRTAVRFDRRSGQIVHVFVPILKGRDRRWHGEPRAELRLTLSQIVKTWRSWQETSGPTSVPTRDRIHFQSRQRRRARSGRCGDRSGPRCDTSRPQTRCRIERSGAR